MRLCFVGEAAEWSVRFCQRTATAFALCHVAQVMLHTSGSDLTRFDDCFCAESSVPAFPFWWEVGFSLRVARAFGESCEGGAERFLFIFVQKKTQGYLLGGRGWHFFRRANVSRACHGTRCRGGTSCRVTPQNARTEWSEVAFNVGAAVYGLWCCSRFSLLLRCAAELWRAYVWYLWVLPQGELHCFDSTSPPPPSSLPTAPSFVQAVLEGCRLTKMCSTSGFLTSMKSFRVLRRVSTGLSAGHGLCPAFRKVAFLLLRVEGFRVHHGAPCVSTSRTRVTKPRVVSSQGTATTAAGRELSL